MRSVTEDDSIEWLTDHSLWIPAAHAGNLDTVRPFLSNYDGTLCDVFSFVNILVRLLGSFPGQFCNQ